MIRIYEQGHEDFASNGLGLLACLRCEVSEEQGAAYELEMDVPMAEDTGWELIKTGRVVRAPVPKQTTPLIEIEASAGYEVWETTQAAKVYTKRTTSMGTKVTVTEPAVYPAPSVKPQYVAFHDETTTTKWKSNGNRILETVKAGTEVSVLSKYSGWYKVTTPKGNTGWVQASQVALVQTVPDIPPETIQARQVRDQLFRIYRTEKDTQEGVIRVWARHISYDLLANALIDCKVKDVSVAAAVAALNANCTPSDHGFSIYTNSTRTVSADWSHKGYLEAILDPEEGILALANLRLVRDNYDLFLLERGDTARQAITYGNNLLGVTVDINEDGIINRIVPVGKKKDGTPLHIDAVFVDSPRNDEATVLKARVLEYDAEERDAKDGEPAVTLEQAKAKLLELAQADFESGIDLPDISVKVDFLQLGDTQEYAAYRDLDRLYLGDIVTVSDTVHQVVLDAEVVRTQYDCLDGRYLGMEVGVTDAARTIGSVESYMIPGGAITGRKLLPGSVDGSRLGRMSVKSMHVDDAAILRAHIAEALIASLKTDALDAVKARIRELVADEITTDQLWADISHIGLADIGTADIDYGQVKDLVTSTAIITQGVGDKLYIARLAVTEANMVSLTVGEMIVKGSDGRFYAVVPDGQGGVTTQLKQVVGADVANRTLKASEKIIEGSITAGELNVQNIFALNATIKKLIAANIDVDTLFARTATINKLNSIDITGNTYLQLALDEKASITLVNDKIKIAVDGMQIGGRNLVPDSNNLLGWNKWMSATKVTPVAADDGMVRVYRAAGVTTTIGIHCPKTFRLRANKEYILTYSYYGFYSGSVNYVYILSGDGNINLSSLGRENIGATTDKITDTIYAVRRAIQFTVPRDVDDARVLLGYYSDVANPDNPEGFYLGKVQVEEGNKATPWSPAPEDPASGVKAAGIDIGPGWMRQYADLDWAMNAGSGASEIGMANARADGLFIWGGGSPTAAKIRMWMDGSARFDQIMIGNSGVNQFTQMYPYTIAENADASNPVVMEIVIPEDCRGVQSVKLWYKLKPFRAYSKSAASGGGSTQTSGNSTGSLATKPSDVVPSVTIGYVSGHTHPIDGPGVPSTGSGGGHNHTTTVTMPQHMHYVNEHNHSVTIPAHGHGIVYGIYIGPQANSATLVVDGTTVGSYASLTAFDIAQYLTKTSGRITRDLWHTVQILPDNLSRVEAQAFVIAVVDTATDPAY